MISWNNKDVVRYCHLINFDRLNKSKRIRKKREMEGIEKEKRKIGEKRREKRREMRREKM